MNEEKVKILRRLEGQYKATYCWVEEFRKYKDKSAALNVAVALGKLQAIYTLAQDICGNESIPSDIKDGMDELGEDYSNLFYCDFK